MKGNADKMYRICKGHALEKLRAFKELKEASLIGARWLMGVTSECEDSFQVGVTICSRLPRAV